MKKLINYSLLFVVAALSISCSKDSSSPSLVGKWSFTAEGAKGTGSTIVWTPISSNACELQSYTEFVSNGTFSDQSYNTNPTTGACELYVDPTPTSSSETWVRSGDDLVITFTDFTVTPSNVDTYKYHIVSLTDSELIFQFYDMQTNLVLTDGYAKLSRR
jgi:hypothetical protein